MQKVVILLLLVFVVGVVFAQDESCAILIEQAIEATNNNCSELGRNQVCYGNAQINATPQESADDFVFESGGDIVDASDIQALQLSSLVEPDEWGIAVFSLQANLPDTLPGQNVTVLMFGDVSIENGGALHAPLIEIAVNTNINVRSGPGTGYNVITGLAAGDTVVADGRNEASDWVRIQLPDDAGTGWLYVPLVTVDGEVSTLDVVEATTTDGTGTTYGPMQAFTFSTGIGSSECDGVPADGILIQTPEGAGKVDLLINEVQISLGSTAFLQNLSDDSIVVGLLEGESTIAVEDASAFVPAGAQAVIVTASDEETSNAPVVEPLEVENLGNVPIELLPREIEIPDPLTQAEIDALAFGGIESGEWASSVAGQSLPYTCNRSEFSTRMRDFDTVNIENGVLIFNGIETSMTGERKFLAERQFEVTGCDGSCGTIDQTLVITIVSSNEILVNMNDVWTDQVVAGKVCTLEVEYTLTPQ